MRITGDLHQHGFEAKTEAPCALGVALAGDESAALVEVGGRGSARGEGWEKEGGSESKAQGSSSEGCGSRGC